MSLYPTAHACVGVDTIEQPAFKSANGITVTVDCSSARLVQGAVTYTNGTSGATAVTNTHSAGALTEYAPMNNSVRSVQLKGVTCTTGQTDTK